MDVGKMLGRMVRAAMLNKAVYSEVEHDKSLDQEALRVVVLVSLLDGIGLVLIKALSPDGTTIVAAATRLLFAVLAGVLVYWVWAYVTHMIGTGFFHGKADIGQMRRTLGYATTPRALGLLVFVPTVGVYLALVAWLWTLVAGIVAVREGLDITGGKAIATVIASWFVAFLLFWFLAFLVGIPFLLLFGQA
jgi:hypothetical protein